MGRGPASLEGATLCGQNAPKKEREKGRGSTQGPKLKKAPNSCKPEAEWELTPEKPQQVIEWGSPAVVGEAGGTSFPANRISVSLRRRGLTHYGAWASPGGGLPPPKTAGCWSHPEHAWTLKVLPFGGSHPARWAQCPVTQRRGGGSATLVSPKGKGAHPGDQAPGLPSPGPSSAASAPSLEPRRLRCQVTNEAHL